MICPDSWEGFQSDTCFLGKMMNHVGKQTRMFLHRIRYNYRHDWMNNCMSVQGNEVGLPCKVLNKIPICINGSFSCLEDFVKYVWRNGKWSFQIHGHLWNANSEKKQKQSHGWVGPGSRFNLSFVSDVVYDFVFLPFLFLIFFLSCTMRIPISISESSLKGKS